ncbi:hypothetical protein MYX77_02580 [Acidobacteriia bacterium AH_259_A11_L15]|nr:hypothetical protein [Acidobacteriia bacterium AH_259_A11_L15]
MIPHEVVNGDIVVFLRDGEISHTAVVLVPEWIGKSFVPLVISKWGEAAEYIHTVNNSPDEYGREIRYWTDRPA